MADTKMVIVARKDLGLSAGKLAAQVGHACVDAADTARKQQPDRYFDWLNSGQMKVVVRANSRDELFQLKDLAEGQGLTTALIRDAGHTELDPGTFTCLAVGPGPQNLVDKITGDLKLYG